MNLPTTVKYTIQQGDPLYKIAREHNTTIIEILNLNPNINPYSLFEGQIIIVPLRTYKQFESREYNVIFKYPQSWKMINDAYYEGESGFFHVSAISSVGSIEDVCKSEACHRLLPYGSRPHLRMIHHLGKKACIITPSDDQSPEMKNQAAFIVEYPFDLEIQGDKYNFFLLWASKDNIEDIVKTIKFKVVKN